MTSEEVNRFTKLGSTPNIPTINQAAKMGPDYSQDKPQVLENVAYPKDFVGPIKSPVKRDIKGDLRLVGGLAQSLLRGGASIGATIAGPLSTGGKMPNEVPNPTTVGKFLFGDAPIETIPGTYQRGQEILSHEGYGPTSSALVAGAASLAPLLYLLGLEGESAVSSAIKAEEAAKETSVLRRGWSLPKESQTTIQKAFDLTQKNGGVTINLKGEIPTQGFSVATSKATEQIVPQTDFTVGHLMDYVDKNWENLQNSKSHIGTWIDNGQVYMDVPSVFTNQAEAVKAALKADQLGIFDLNKFETIGKEQYAKIIADDEAFARGNQGRVQTTASTKPPTTKAGGQPGQVKPFTGFKDLTTKVLDRLIGRGEISKQFISDLTNAGDLKQSERDLIRNLLADEPETVDVKDFANKVHTELLRLERSNVAPGFDNPGRYENIALPDEVRGNVADYSEHIYQSPIKTSAGDVHFNGDEYPNYFAHTRVEDMADRPLPKGAYIEKFGEQGGVMHPTMGNTRRIIELQSDLMQKGNLEQMLKQEIHSNQGKITYGGKPVDFLAIDRGNNTIDIRPQGGRATQVPLDKFIEQNPEATKGYRQLLPYENNWNPRIIREEVKQAAIDNKTKLQFPTGETAMKIEGLGEGGHHWELVDPKNPTSNLRKLDISDLKTGSTINDGESSWIITDVLGDGKFKAVPKNIYEKYSNPDMTGTAHQRSQRLGNLESSKEQFDISGKVDTNNPIYKFYEKEVGRYLKNKYGATKITDSQGVTWYEVPIKKAQGRLPIEAFAALPVSTIIKKKE